MGKDYYNTLGLKRDASSTDIKRAYRKLARKYHPDLNPGDKAAESKFKEIQEAYAVLNDSAKKKQYDQFGFVGDMPPGGSPHQGYSTGGFEGFNFSNFGSSSFSDFFENIFGSSQRASPQRSERGDDLLYSMKLSFTDAINGVKTRIKLTRMAACETCSGYGFMRSKGQQACRTCGGTGQSHMQTGAMRFSTTCHSCRGSGISQGTECSTCHGLGQTRKTELISVRIPSGVDTGSKIRIQGKGNAGARGGPSGDLFINIEVDPHKLFRREGSNIYIKIPVTVPEATLGAKIEVPTIYGKTTIRIPPGTRSGQKFRLRNKGVLSPGKKVQGDQFVEVLIVPPPFNNERIRELVKEIEKVSEENPRHNLGI